MATRLLRAALLALLLTAVAAPAAALVSHLARPIVVGALLPLSGPLQYYGEEAKRGLELARQDRPDVLDRPVKLVYVDTASTVRGAEEGVRRLVTQDVAVAIIGPLASAGCQGAAKLCDQARTVMLAPWLAGSAVTEKKTYAFRMLYTDVLQGQVAARFVFHNLHNFRAMVMADLDQPYSKEASKIFGKTFRELGGKLVGAVTYRSGDRTFAQALKSIQVIKPQAVFLPGYGPEIMRVLKQAKEMGIKTSFVCVDAAHTPELIVQTGEAAEDVYVVTHYDRLGVATASGQSFAADYTHRHGRPPEALAALGYDCYRLLISTFRRAGSPEPELVAPILAGTYDFPSATGYITLRRRDMTKPAFVFQVKEGQFKYIGVQGH